MLQEEDFSRISKQIDSVKYPIVTIKAPTGSGKTQLIPPFLIRKYGKKILVAVPTKEAARSNWLSVKNTFDKNSVGIKIGYAAGGRMSYDEDTVLVYATSGHVKNRLLANFSSKGIRPLGNYFLIIDESHTLSIENTIIMGLWKKAFDSGIEVPFLILMTATPITILNFTINMLVIDKPKRFVVTERHVNEKLTGNDLYERMIDIAINDTGNNGHVLLFVPTIMLAESIAEKIRKRTGKHVTALHSKTSLEDEQRAISPKDKKEYIVATNVVESSVTIRDLVYVIDSMREKVPTVTSNGGIMLEEKYITLQSSIQRRGRIGRTRNGVYWSMVPKDFRLIPYKKEEYLNIPIYNEVLELNLHGIGISEIFPKKSQNDILSINNFLIKHKMILEDRVTIGFQGIFAGFTKLSIPMSRFLWLWLSSGGPTYWGAVIVSIIDTDISGLFKINLNPNDKKYSKAIKENFGNYIAPDHLSTLLNLWIDLERHTKGSLKNKLAGGGKNINKWAKTKNLDGSVLIAISETLARTLSGLNKFSNRLERYPEVKSLNIDVSRLPAITIYDIIQKTTPIFKEIFFDRIIKKSPSGTFINTLSRDKPYVLSFRMPMKHFINGNELIVLTYLETDQKYIVTIGIYSEFNPRLYTAPILDILVPQKPEILDLPINNFVSPVEMYNFEFFPEISSVNPIEIGLFDITIPSSLLPRSILGFVKTQLEVQIYEPKYSFLGVPPKLMFNQKAKKPIEYKSIDYTELKFESLSNRKIQDLDEGKTPLDLRDFKESLVMEDINEILDLYVD